MKVFGVSNKYTKIMAFCAAICIGVTVIVIQSIRSKDLEGSLNAIYFWKTTFELNEWEKKFLSEHNIQKLYLRMFDVDVEDDIRNDRRIVVPIATTKFKEIPPIGIEVVPTVFITLDALKQMGSMEELAQLIIKRVLAMSSYNELGVIKELQIDCDWTQSTEEKYNDLCRHMRSILEQKNIGLSSTIRLHQVGGAVSSDVQSYVLMLYNAVSIANTNTNNSILSYEDIHPYLMRKKNIKAFENLLEAKQIAFNLALPTFAWGVVFKDGKFDRLVRNYSQDFPDSLIGEWMRIEECPFGEIKKVKDDARRAFKRTKANIVIYHLDSLNLVKYTSDEIKNIYN
jgi:hypothetical protein